jgi:hypothetical protein
MYSGLLKYNFSASKIKCPVSYAGPNIEHFILLLNLLRILSSMSCRAIAEAVSRWLPIAAARVRAQVWQVGFVLRSSQSPGAVNKDLATS